MAELVGLVASGIGIAQVAGSILSSVIKLKGYWDQIKEAPEDLNHLVREIEVLHSILRNVLESQAKNNPPLPQTNAFVDESLKLCQESADELDNIVNELARYINSGQTSQAWKRKLRASKIILKSDQLKKLKKKMKNAVALLHLAITCQTNATLHQQSNVLSSMVQTSLNEFAKRIQSTVVSLIPATTCSNPRAISNSYPEASPRLAPNNTLNTESNVRSIFSPIISQTWSRYLVGYFEYERLEQGRGRKRLQKSSATYNLPEWLSNRAWQYMYIKDLSTLRWQNHFQIYRTLDETSEFCRYLLAGDIAGVQEMLANGTVFVNDRFDIDEIIDGVYWWTGLTALHIAAYAGNVDLCKLLLREGADVSCVHRSDIGTPLALMAGTAASLNHFRHFNPFEIIRLLYDAGAKMELIDDTTLLETSEGPLDVWEFLQCHSYPRESVPFSKACQVLCNNYGIAGSRWSHGPSILRLALGGVPFRTICTGFINRLGYEVLAGIDAIPFDAAEKLPWVDLMHQMILCGMTVFSKPGDGISLLQSIQESMNGNDFFPDDMTKLKHSPTTIPILLQWLGHLRLLGVDLVQYGENELSYLKQLPICEFETLSYGCRLFDWNRYSRLNPTSHIISFTYGPCVKDWHFWFPEPTDEFAGDFWSLIENPPLETVMPGAWVEE